MPWVGRSIPATSTAAGAGSEDIVALGSSVTVSVADGSLSLGEALSVASGSLDALDALDGLVALGVSSESAAVGSASSSAQDDSARPSTVAATAAARRGFLIGGGSPSVGPVTGFWVPANCRCGVRHVAWLRARRRVRLR